MKRAQTDGVMRWPHGMQITISAYEFLKYLNEISEEIPEQHGLSVGDEVGLQPHTEDGRS